MPATAHDPYAVNLEDYDDSSVEIEEDVDESFDVDWDESWDEDFDDSELYDFGEDESGEEESLCRCGLYQQMRGRPESGHPQVS